MSSVQIHIRTLGDTGAFRNADVAFTAVTRLNVHDHEVFEARKRGVQDLDREARDAWCDQRVKLFKEFCLPPMLAQRPVPHAWFLLVDAVPIPPVDRLLEELRDIPWIVPVPIERGLDQQGALAAVAAAVHHHLQPLKPTYVCQARLDSDDSLHVRYFAMLDRAISQLRPGWGAGRVQCINFPYGVAREGDVFAIFLNNKHFFALLEPFEAIRSPYQVPHKEIDQIAPVIDILTERPMWIYHRHGTNIGTLNVGKFERFADVPRLLANFGFVPTPSWAEPDDRGAAA